MSISLTKGGNVSLTKEAPGLHRRDRRPRLGRPHHRRPGLRPRRQRDRLQRRRQGALADSTSSSSTTCTSPDGAIQHTGDNLTGEGEGDDEQIKVNLAGAAGRRRQDRLPGLDLRRRDPRADLRPGPQRLHPRGQPGRRRRDRPLRPVRGRLDRDRDGVRRAVPQRRGLEVPRGRPGLQLRAWPGIARDFGVPL